MIDRCFNPACNKELHYLRDGRAVRAIHGKGENTSLEHYWLCGSCCQSHEFLFPSHGKVKLGIRAERQAPDESYFDEEPWTHSPFR
jgi:hypothetical protein